MAGQLLRRLATSTPEGVPQLRRVTEQLPQTLSERWEHLGHPLPRPLLERACAIAGELDPSAGDLLVNYDLTYTDVLAGDREPWLVVDPKVVAGDPEYGVAQLLWRRLEEMQAWTGGLDWYFQALVEAADLDG